MQIPECKSDLINKVKGMKIPHDFDASFFSCDIHSFTSKTAFGYFTKILQTIKISFFSTCSGKFGGHVAAIFNSIPIFLKKVNNSRNLKKQQVYRKHSARPINAAFSVVVLSHAHPFS